MRVPSESFEEYVLRKIDELKKLFLEKNKQYGDYDPLGDFRRGACLRYGEATYPMMYEIAKSYNLKHIAHIYEHDAFGEKIEESLKDIAVYSIIEMYLIDRARMQRVLAEESERGDEFYGNGPAPLPATKRQVP